jgi:transposase InsO family protein
MSFQPGLRLFAYADRRSDSVQYCSPLEGRTSTMKIALMTTYDGRKYRMLNVIDEFTHECLAICINRKLEAVDVIQVLSDLFILRGVPGHIQSGNGSEFVAKAAREWIAAVGAKNRLHRARQPMEERLHRKLQCSSPRRTAQW